MTQEITITLPNGLKLTGSPAMISQTAKELGYTNTSDFYYSSTHGPLLITAMDTNHIHNAMLKTYRDWATGLSKLTGRDLVQALRNGCTDGVFVALLKEYIARH